MLESLIAIDHSISLAINSWSAPWLDGIMIFISGKFSWIPLYAIILFGLFKKFKPKTATIFLLAIGLAFALSDQISVAMKFGFERLRPCHNESLNDVLRAVVGCGGKFGFVSSHASNTMSLAIITSLIFRKQFVWISMLTYSLLNGYSRIYLGKHFLGDVLGGFALGVIVAFISYFLAKYILQKLNLAQ